MSDKGKRVAGRVLAVLLGTVWAFFVAFNSVFSDVFGLSGHIGAGAYVFAGYALLGLLFGAIGHVTGPRWMWWLVAPAGAILVLYSFGETGRIWWHAIVLALATFGAGGGASLGAAARERLSRPNGTNRAAPSG